MSAAVREVVRGMGESGRRVRGLGWGRGRGGAVDWFVCGGVVGLGMLGCKWGCCVWEVLLGEEREGEEGCGCFCNTLWEFVLWCFVFWVLKGGCSVPCSI